MGRYLLGTACIVTLTAQGVAAQPALSVRDSIILHQTEAFLTVPTSVVPDGDGYLVTDAQQAHVFRFAKDGQLAGVYGSEGEGPGEFRQAVAALPYDDSAILVASWTPRAVQTFDRATGGLIERVPLQRGTDRVVLSESTLWVSGVDYATRTVLERVAWGDRAGEPMVALPDSYEPGEPLHGMFPSIPFTKWGDTLLVGFEPLSELALVTTAGVEVERFDVPALHRRGTPPDPANAVRGIFLEGPFHAVFGSLSALRGVHRRSDGSVLLVHFDSRSETPPVSSEVFVSVLSRDRSEVCADARVPLGPGAQPAIGFDGDGLLVLEQVIEGLDATAVLRLVHVDASDCEWREVPH